MPRRTKRTTATATAPRLRQVENPHRQLPDPRETHEPSVPVRIRLSQQDVDRLKTLARDSERSAAAQAARLIRQALDAHATPFSNAMTYSRPPNYQPTFSNPPAKTAAVRKRKT